MKKILALSLLLSVLALGAGAQNHYRNYKTYPRVTAPLSAVSLVHSDTTVYFFQTDEKELSVTPIDPANLLQTGTPKYATQVQRFMMKGAFEDSNGKCVVFGHKHISPVLSNPAFAVVDLSSNNIDYYIFPFESSALVHGCLGYDIYGIEIYMFVLENGQLMAVDMSNGCFGRIVPYFGEHYTDISWDDSNHRFIATGTLAYGQANPGIVVDLFEYNSQDAMAGLTSAIQHYLQYFVDNLSINNAAEHQALHVVLDSFHPCVPILIAGADSLSGIGVLTETYDIYDSSYCDLPLPIDFKPVSPQILPYTLTDSISIFSQPTCVTSLLVDENVSEYILCEDPGDCPTLRQDSALTKSLPDSEPYIVLENGRQFVCHLFNGNIQFTLYDLLGKAVVSGETKNGLLNPLPHLQGVFILQAADSKGHQAVKKVLIIP